MVRDEVFNKIIDSLHVKYYRSSLREIIKPAELNGSLEPRNILVRVDSGFCYGEKNFVRIDPGNFYFMPVGSPIYFRHGKAKNFPSFGKDGFTSVEHREQYLKPLSINNGIDSSKDIFSIIGFDVHIYGAIPFFSILELPCFIMPDDEEMRYLIHAIIAEEENKKPGRERLLKNLTEEMVIHICRFIYHKKEFEKNFEKVHFLLDKRLVDIIQFIQGNLHEDLTNQKIANLAYVSKDYVGQFFKSLTNTNLQDYIENQRLERAHNLLRSTHYNVQEIATNVGFKDPAYFSRRFKNKFKRNANQVRKESIVNV